MKNVLRLLSLSLFFLAASAPAQQQPPQGPFPPDQWPPTVDPTKTVHYMSVGDAIQPPTAPWENTLTILSNGDQTTSPISIGGFNGVKATGNYINIADVGFTEWADDETIDILAQVYGDGAVLATDGTPRDFAFLIGTLPEIAAPIGGRLPVEAKNGQWNWVLFRIPNS